MWSKSFWAQVAERAVKTFAQAAVVLLGADQVGLLSADWLAVGSVAGMAAVVSVLTSLGSAPFGPDASPSVVATVPGPSTEAVRILTSPADPAMTEAVREAARKLGPGWPR